MMACYLNRDGECMLFSEYGSVIGVLIPLDDQILAEQSKRHHGPSRWFKMDGHRVLGKPPDREDRKGA